MSNTRARYPSPPPPAPPFEEELLISVATIAGVCGVSLIVLLALLLVCRGKPMSRCCSKDVPPPPPTTFMTREDQCSVIRATDGHLDMAGLRDHLATHGEVSEVSSGTLLSEGSIAAQKMLVAAWNSPQRNPSDTPPAEPVAATPRGGRETMDQRLQQQAAERVQQAARAKMAREQRARFLKAGGRPTERDHAAWHAPAVVPAGAAPVRLDHGSSAHLVPAGHRDGPAASQGVGLHAEVLWASAEAPATEPPPRAEYDI